MSYFTVRRDYSHGRTKMTRPIFILPRSKISRSCPRNLFWKQEAARWDHDLFVLLLHTSPICGSNWDDMMGCNWKLEVHPFCFFSSSFSMEVRGVVGNLSAFIVAAWHLGGLLLTRSPGAPGRSLLARALQRCLCFVANCGLLSNELWFG